MALTWELGAVVGGVGPGEGEDGVRMEEGEDDEEEEEEEDEEEEREEEREEEEVLPLGGGGRRGKHGCCGGRIRQRSGLWQRSSGLCWIGWI